jgi:hypothetical protein
MTDKTETLTSKLGELTTEYSKTKHNKATNLHLGILRAKIAKVKREITVSKKRLHGTGFFVKKTGDATVALIGFPSAGKSSLINAISNTRSKTAQYAFTTTSIIPGTMLYKDAHIQIFDMPGLIEDAHLGVGGGRMVIAAMKVADLIVFVIDINILKQFDQLMAELGSLDIRINKKKPSMQITELINGGIHIEVNKSGLPKLDIEAILQGLGIHSANVSIWDKVNEDEFISLVSGKAQYMKAVVVLNKMDTKEDYQKVAAEFIKKYGMKTIPISATELTNIEEFKDAIYENLGIVTIYLKPKMGDERMMPMILKKGATVGDAARKFHTEIVDELKCAQIVGRSAKFSNQKVGVTHVLQEGDIITFIKNK